MAPSNEFTADTQSRKIEYLSAPANVSMSDDYFNIAGTDHFWVRRRFHVLEKLAGPLLRNAREIAEIGCGHGLLQRQIEMTHGKGVTGFDLNQFGLQHNISQTSRVCCYDIYQQAEEFRERFDLILLFDVLEHISNEETFLEAILFHLAPGGSLIVSVPAGQWAYSSYDRVAGHVRRYSIATLKATARRTNLTSPHWTYWGFPLLPALLIRKLAVSGKTDEREIYNTGFNARSTLLNTLLELISECEIVPQHLAGTSVMAVFERLPSRDLNAPR